MKANRNKQIFIISTLLIAAFPNIFKSLQRFDDIQ